MNFWKIVLTVREQLEKLYYSIPEGVRPKPKVIGGVIGAPIGAVLLKLVEAGLVGDLLTENTALILGAALGSLVVAWIVPEKK